MFTFMFLTGSGPETGPTGERLNDKEKVGHLTCVMRRARMRRPFMSSKNAWGCGTSHLESTCLFTASVLFLCLPSEKGQACGSEDNLQVAAREPAG